MLRKALFTIICALMLLGAAPTASACGRAEAFDDVRAMAGAYPKPTVKNNERMGICIVVAGAVGLAVTVTVAVLVIKKRRHGAVKEQRDASRYIVKNASKITSRHDERIGFR